MKINLPYFFKTFKKGAAEWKCPYLYEEEKVYKHLVAQKRVADSIEALIGACFVNQYSLENPL